MTRRSAPDPLGRLRYVPAALSPIGIVAIVLLIVEGNHRVVFWVYLVVLFGWSVTMIGLGLKLRGRLRQDGRTQQQRRESS